MNARLGRRARREKARHQLARDRKPAFGLSVTDLGPIIAALNAAAREAAGSVSQATMIRF